MLNTRKVHLAHFLKKSGYSPFQLQALGMQRSEMLLYALLSWVLQFTQ